MSDTMQKACQTPVALPPEVQAALRELKALVRADILAAKKEKKR